MKVARNGIAGIVFLALIAGQATPASGQYIFADASGDGVSTADDRLNASEAAKVDIWLQTDRNRDGTEADRGATGIGLSIFSYEFVLRATGGTVQWGEYTNALPSMSFPLVQLKSPEELVVGYTGTTALPPGKYKLGTVEVSVVSGNPSLDFRAWSSIGGGLPTCFGSMNPGKSRGYTLVFTEDRSKLTRGTPGIPADWADADGVGAPLEGGELAAPVAGGAALRFSVEVTPNPGMRGEAKFSITTTRPGALRVHLFDLQGRLVRTLMDDAEAPAGHHVIERIGVDQKSRRLASGVYWYRVDAVDGVKKGRLVLIR